jgi:hypothetical protein
VSFSRLRRDQGRRAEARELLAPAYGWFTEGFGTPDLKDAKTLLEELTLLAISMCRSPCERPLHSRPYHPLARS